MVRSIFILFFLASTGGWAAETKKPIQSAKKKDFSGMRVKNYHLRAEKTRWDSKTTILEAERNVVTTLYLEDGTTAYIHSDFARENRGAGKGHVWGNVRTLWEGAVIKSPEMTFDSQVREVVFFPKGNLVHRNFANGSLDMDFTTMTDVVDKESQSYMIAREAKGVYQPYPKAKEIKVEPEKKDKKNKK